MKKIRPYLGSCQRPALIGLLACGLWGCGGGAIHFDAGSSGQISVDENTQGSVWSGAARFDGATSPAVITYRLIGPDAQHFLIDASGQVSFLQAADFEYPQDTDKNNEYLVDIEASANTKTAVQSVRIKVTDVSKPQVALVQPKLYENVGKGNEVEVATVVRVFDAESNAPIKSLEVKQNSIALKQDEADPSLWKGNVLVPDGGVDFPLSASLADGQLLTATARLFNKRDSVSPSFLGVNPGTYLFFFDAHQSLLGKLSLASLKWNTYLQYPPLKNLRMFDFNSNLQTMYATFNQPNSEETLMAIAALSATPGFFYAGCLPSLVANVTYDTTNKRVLVVLARQEQDVPRFKVLSFATVQDTGFVDRVSESANCSAAQQHLVWDVPVGVVKGTFKNFNFHRLSKTYIIADERVVNGATFTVIQGFSEAGEKRFETRVGADISNLAINNTAGVIYVAEHHSSAAGKIKAVDIATGRVTNLVQDAGGSLVGAYTQLRIDNVNKLLYVADDVGDAFFVVDLATNKMTELMYQSAIVSP